MWYVVCGDFDVSGREQTEIKAAGKITQRTEREEVQHSTLQSAQLPAVEFSQVTLTQTYVHTLTKLYE